MKMRMNPRDVVLQISDIKIPAGETIKVTSTVVDPFRAEKIVFDGTFEGKGAAFNLWLNSFPFSTSQTLQKGDVILLEVINHSEKMIEASVRLAGNNCQTE